MRQITLFTLLILSMAGCQQKNLVALQDHLVPPNDLWVEAYGNDMEVRQTFNLLLLRSRQETLRREFLKIREEVKRLSMVDPSIDPLTDE